MTGRTNRGRLAAAAILLAVAGGTLALTFVPHPRSEGRAEPLARTAKPAAKPAPTPRPSPTPLTIRRVLPIGDTIAFGDWAWDEKGVPAGPIVVTVDLKAQTMSVFRAGYEIGSAAILYGADEKPTPLGTYPITQKDAHHVSNLYDAPMPYMLRLTNDGVSIHGTSVAYGYATHGCIGVPTPFAKKLFAAASLGDKVIVTRGRLLKLGDPLA